MGAMWSPESVKMCRTFSFFSMRATSAQAPGETDQQFFQFVDAYGADYVTRQGKLVIDDPEIRRRLIRAMAGYTASYRRGCTPPDATGWNDSGNNQAF